MDVQFLQNLISVSPNTKSNEAFQKVIVVIGSVIGADFVGAGVVGAGLVVAVFVGADVVVGGVLVAGLVVTDVVGANIVMHVYRSIDR